jgi:hypothetical protein
MKRPGQLLHHPHVGPVVSMTLKGELEKTKTFHGIVPAIPRPQLQVVNGSRRGNQCVTQFDAVALGVLSQICTRALADLNIDGDTPYRPEKNLKNLLVPRPSSVP